MEARFNRAVAILFALVATALVIATLENAPLSFDGGYYLFRVLDGRTFMTDHGRFINLVLQAPVVAAMRHTDDLRILRAVYSAGYATTPIWGLALSWMVCRSRRPSLFIWPALSICVASLPGQFQFQAESIAVVSLLWPALLAVLIGAPGLVLALVALSSIVAAVSHPTAMAMLAEIAIAGVIAATARGRARKTSLGLAIFAGVLILARALRSVDSWERHEFAFSTVVDSFNSSVLGWPLAAIIMISIAALACLVRARRRGRLYLLTPTGLAGLALIMWSADYRDWTNCYDYRYWAGPMAMMFMAGAALDELWPREPNELERQRIRLYAIPMMGAIFLAVLSIQSVQWGWLSGRLAQELAESDRGCLGGEAVASLGDTPLRHWSVTLYALDLQSRRPHTLILTDELNCQRFALRGDAVMVDQEVFKYRRPRGGGWFDFDDAQSRARARLY